MHIQSWELCVLLGLGVHICKLLLWVVGPFCLMSRLRLFAFQKHERRYASRVTKLFFEELDKGVASPLVVLTAGIVVSLASWKVLTKYVEPTRELAAARRWRPRVSLAEERLAGDEQIPAGARGSEELRTQAEGETEFGSAVSRAEGSKQTSTWYGGAAGPLGQPQLVHSEASELRTEQGGTDRAGGLDVICFELSEYDDQLRDDAVYRSVHYIESAAEGKFEQGATRGSSQPASAPVSGDTSQRSGQRRQSGMRDGGSGTGGAWGGVHGMVKCTGITTQNNCVPASGHLEQEYARKMMLALGPVHILRDAAKATFSWRFTYAKEVPISALVCGLHSGELPRWLSERFPNFRVDVVEPDGALARLCRRFLGFKESNNLGLHVGCPVEFLQRAAAQGGSKYDLILLDVIDGAGRLSPQYGRLEFATAVRNCLTNSGCVALALPNANGRYLFDIVQNWRMSFEGRTLILLHCMTSPYTVMLTFQDSADRGKANFGSVANVTEFQDLLRTKLAHYGSRRIPFDLTSEVNEGNFRVLGAGKTYPLESYLPRGHPDLLNARSHGERRRVSWGKWLSNITAGFLTPGQKADLQLARGTAP